MDHDEVVRTNALEGYLWNVLDNSERDAFESHMFACMTCTEDLSFYEELRNAVRDDPELGERFRTEHASAAYVLEDLSPERQQAFEIHMKTCKPCAHNVTLGKELLDSFLAPGTVPADGTRVLNTLRFVRWFRLVFGD